MIRKLWFYPPLAFARVGPSETPYDNFLLGPSDLSPRGTGKTTIVPAETIRVTPNGLPSVVMPTEIVFKDAAGFRPICPFSSFTGSGNSMEHSRAAR